MTPVCLGSVNIMMIHVNWWLLLQCGGEKHDAAWSFRRVMLWCNQFSCAFVCRLFCAVMTSISSPCLRRRWEESSVTASSRIHRTWWKHPETKRVSLYMKNMDMVSCHACKPGVPLWVHDITWTFAFGSSLSTLPNLDFAHGMVVTTKVTQACYK